MSVLTASGQSDFNTLKGMLGVSDGNLASHIRALEELGYVETIKQFIGRKPNTSYFVTDEGRKAFSAHIEALTSLLGIRS
jgi:DNA-binding MarR family transcriptional regulator